MHACAHAHIHARTHKCMCPHTHTHTQTYIYTHIVLQCMHTHTDTHTHTQTHTHTHTQTHTHICTFTDNTTTKTTISQTSDSKERRIMKATRDKGKQEGTNLTFAWHHKRWNGFPASALPAPHTVSLGRGPFHWSQVVHFHLQLVGMERIYVCQMLQQTQSWSIVILFKRMMIKHFLWLNSYTKFWVCLLVSLLFFKSCTYTN